jgi:nucleotide-binding universal stress UspA family protein
MTGSQPRACGDEAWLGYTFADLRRIADRATAYCRWGDRFPFAERFDIAWAGVIDYLTTCGDTPPEPFDVYKAAQRAIGRASEEDLREHGLRHGPAGLYVTPHFDIYWKPRPAPPADATVVDRLAVWQIWATLRPLHKMALLALAAHNDYATAAQSVGYPYSTFTSLICEARAEFFALWHEAETPSRLWAADRRGDGDVGHRARRAIAAKRRRNREPHTDAEHASRLPG